MSTRAPELRPSRVDRRRNSQQILEAAATVLAVDPGASVQAIAVAAGLSRLTVYRHYPTREALEQALLSAIDAQTRTIVATLPDWGAGPATLRALVLGLAELVERYPVITMRHRVETGERRATVDVTLSEVFRAGQQAGVLRADIDPDILNATLFALLSVQARLCPRRGAAASAAEVADLLLHGLDPAGTR